MTKQQLRKLIKESRALLKTATPAQKVRLLSLIRESYRSINEKQNPRIVVLEEYNINNSSDYLDEK
jgi:hypothetical protein